MLLHYENTVSETADLTITGPKNALLYIMRGDLENAKKSMLLQGDTDLFSLFVNNMNLLDLSEVPSFNIIEP